MSSALQVALFLASIAVTIFVAFLVPVFIGLCKYARRATRELEELKSEVKLLVQDSRNTLQNVNDLTSRARRQLEEVDKMVRSAREWSERASHIVDKVGDVVEAPIFTMARVISIAHTALSHILGVLTKKEHPVTLKEAESPAPKGSA